MVVVTQEQVGGVERERKKGCRWSRNEGWTYASFPCPPTRTTRAPPPLVIFAHRGDNWPILMTDHIPWTAHCVLDGETACAKPNKYLFGDSSALKRSSAIWKNGDGCTIGFRYGFRGTARFFFVFFFNASRAFVWRWRRISNLDNNNSGRSSIFLFIQRKVFLINFRFETRAN